MKKRSVLLGGIIVVVSLLGCSNRERSNPLDPRNPETRGKPTGLWIQSDRHNIILEWHLLQVDGLLGYHVYRRMEDQDAFELIDLVAPDAASYTDVGLPYDQEVTYSISAVADGYESPLSDSVLVTPGPYNYWLVDAYFLEVVKLTYDVRHVVVQSIDTPYPVAVAADSVTGTVWVLDLYSQLVKLSGEGEPLAWVDDVVDAIYMTMDEINGVVWVGDYDGTRVARYDISGTRIGETSGFTRISEMSCVGSSGGCWIADREGQNVILLSADGSVSMRFDDRFDDPISIGAYRRENWAWVADSTRLIRARSDGSLEEMCVLDNTIYTLSVDQTTGDCWLVTILEDGVEDEIVKVAVDGTVLLRVGGFRQAEDLVANDYNGGCLVADTGNYRVVRLSSRGEILQTMEDFGSPWSLSVE